MASWKDSKVTWAVTEMLKMAQAGDRKGVERLNDKAYEWARGSNNRKDELRKGYDRAMAILAAK